MTAAEAIDIALKARPKWEVLPEFQPGTAEKRIVEIVKGAPVDQMPGPGPVRDLVAWVVQLVFEDAWVEFAIEDQGGEIIRFRRSR
jgi:hypothetical protein